MNVKLRIRALRIAAVIEIGERKCVGQGKKFAEYFATHLMSTITRRLKKKAEILL
jgi:hypothetical protein